MMRFMITIEASSVSELSPTSLLDDRLRRPGLPRFAAECSVVVAGHIAWLLASQVSKISEVSQQHTALMIAAYGMAIFNWGWIGNNWLKGIRGFRDQTKKDDEDLKKTMWIWSTYDTSRGPLRDYDDREGNIQ